ncbi:MAG: sulfite exporter TauE/SafE family protein, partial [Planctomycetota bacterium]
MIEGVTIAELTALFAVAFTGGVAGSAHCVAMCGPFVGVTALREPPQAATGEPDFAGSTLPMARRPSPGGARFVLDHGFYQLGRMTAYLGLAVLAGTFGHLILRLGSVVQLQTALAVAMAIMLCAIGATYLFGGDGHKHSHGPSRSIPILSPILAFARQTGGLTGAYVTGLCASLLPCGFLYTFVVAAALTGSLVGAIVTLLGFFLGTLPALAGAALFARVSKGVGFARGRRRLVGVALIALGVVGLLGKVRALPTPPASADTLAAPPDCCETGAAPSETPAV